MLQLAKLRNCACPTVMITLLIVITTLAQQTPRELFERARLLDESNQNLGEAIKLYSQVAAQAKDQRNLAARAQLRVGILYDRLGRKAEAQRAYQAVLSQFSDVDEVARQAKSRLTSNGVNPTKTASTLAVRRVLADSDMNSDLYLLSAPSPDGRYLCYRDGKTLDLAVRELATGEKRIVTTNQNFPPEASGYPQFPIFSPDSKQVAYTWIKADRSQELRVSRLDGTALRVLYLDKEVAEIMPAEWSWDGQQILTLLRHKESGCQIALLAVANGTTHVLKTLGRFGSSKLSLSPDGRYLAYDFPQQEGVRENDVFLLATDGSSETRLIAHPSHDRLLGWAPDGKKILFGSDRTGTMGAWLIRVADGQPQGEPELVKHDLGRIFTMGFTRSGAYYYAQENTNLQAYIATLDFATGNVLAPATPFLRRAHGAFASPAFSPDGEYLAYGTVRALSPRKPGSDILTLRTLSTGKERELAPALEYFDLCGWAPDGRSLLLSGRENNGNRGLYQVEASTGELTTLWLSDPKASWILQAEWSPDSKKIFYLRENRLLARELVTGQEKELHRGPVMRFALSPDGQQLAIAQDQSLKLLPTAGGEARELLTLQRPEAIVAVAWSPDGRQLLFGRSDVTQYGQPTDLWRVSVAGGEPQKLELTVAGLRELRVHPDGQQIAFSSFRLQREVWVMENFLPAAQSQKTSVSRR